MAEMDFNPAPPCVALEKELTVPCIRGRSGASRNIERSKMKVSVPYETLVKAEMFVHARIIEILDKIYCLRTSGLHVDDYLKRDVQEAQEVFEALQHSYDKAVDLTHWYETWKQVEEIGCAAAATQTRKRWKEAEMASIAERVSNA
jgi:hypothetical protein